MISYFNNSVLYIPNQTALYRQHNLNCVGVNKKKKFIEACEENITEEDVREMIKKSQKNYILLSKSKDKDVIDLILSIKDETNRVEILNRFIKYKGISSFDLFLSDEEVKSGQFNELFNSDISKIIEFFKRQINLPLCFFHQKIPR